MADIITHSLRTDTYSIYKLYEAVNHVTHDVWPLSNIKRSRNVSETKSNILTWNLVEIIIMTAKHVTHFLNH